MVQTEPQNTAEEPIGKTARRTFTPIEAAASVLGRHPKDAILYAEIGADTLDWLETVFRAIEVLQEKGGSEFHIKRLAGLGRYVASDLSEHIGAEHDKMAEAIKAAEAGEVRS